MTKHHSATINQVILVRLRLQLNAAIAELNIYQTMSRNDTGAKVLLLWVRNN